MTVLVSFKSTILIFSTLIYFADAFCSTHTLARSNLLLKKKTHKLNRVDSEKSHITSSLLYPRIPVTTTHVFNYQNIPYHLGIRHIHALEHVADIHILSFPFFKLKNTTLPVTIGPYSIISCYCEVFGAEKRVKMFTNKPNECQIMCFFNEKNPQLHIHLSVSPLLQNKNKMNGHSLTMVCTYYRAPKWIYLRLKPLFDFLHFMEDSLFWSYDFREQDLNLAKYRRMVIYSFKHL
jgi:hypothetical protein